MSVKKCMKRFLVFAVCFVGLFALNVKAEKTVFYLATIAPGHSPNLVSRELAAANIEVVGIEEGLILFGINEKTHVTPFLKSVPFLNALYVDRGSVVGEESVYGKRLATVFLDLIKEEGTADKPAKDVVIPKSMADIDQLLRKKTATADSTSKPGGKMSREQKEAYAEKMADKTSQATSDINKKKEQSPKESGSGIGMGGGKAQQKSSRKKQK